MRARFSICSSKRRRCSAGSVSSPKPLASSTPQAKSSKRSAKRGVLGLGPRQRRLARRIVAEQRRPRPAELRLDLLAEYLAEQVGPVIIRHDPDPVPLGGAGEAVAVADQRGEVDAGIAIESLAAGDRLRLLIRIDARAAIGESLHAQRLGGDGEQAGAILHQPLGRLLGPIPLQHGEFRMVEGAALAVAERAGEGEDALLPGRQQLFAGKLRRCMEIEPARRARSRDSDRRRRPRYGSRCRARAGAPPSRPRRSLDGRKTAAGRRRFSREP